jgi:hypothetical protein
MRAGALDLGLRESERIPLKAALVIDFPMRPRMLFTDRHNFAFGSELFSRTEDRTGEGDWEESFPLERELVRVSSGAFRQIFRETDFLREAPPPGAYGAVVLFGVQEVEILDQTDNKKLPPRREAGVAMKWSLRVLDARGAEAFEMGHVTPMRTRGLGLGRGSAFAEAVGELACEQIACLVREAAGLLRSSSKMRGLATPARP